MFKESKSIFSKNYQIKKFEIRNHFFSKNYSIKKFENQNNQFFEELGIKFWKSLLSNHKKFENQNNLRTIKSISNLGS